MLVTIGDEMRAQPKKQSTIKFVLIAAVACLLLILLGVGWAVMAPGKKTAVKEGQTVTVEIAQGSGTAAIAQKLSDAGLIKSPVLFRLQSRLSNSDGAFKAGVYKLVAGTSQSEIFDLLKKGPQAVYVTVTIPEGKTIAQIAQLLDKKAGINAQEFTSYAQSAAPELAKTYTFLKGAYNNSLEGFLFPDTYRIEADATPEKVANMMVKRFDEVWSQLDVPQARSKRYTTLQLVTIASLVEREVAHASDRPLVASVIDNRLAQGMKLQFCSTVQFLLPGEEERTKIRLTNADISIDSPYNTYKNQGLPPGPIANPGKAALEAALNPASTGYLFFQVVDTKGTTKFDKTSQEFAATKAKAKATIGQ